MGAGLLANTGTVDAIPPRRLLRGLTRSHRDCGCAHRPQWVESRPPQATAFDPYRTVVMTQDRGGDTPLWFLLGGTSNGSTRRGALPLEHPLWVGSNHSQRRCVTVSSIGFADLELYMLFRMGRIQM